MPYLCHLPVLSIVHFSMHNYDMVNMVKVGGKMAKFRVSKAKFDFEMIERIQCLFHFRLHCTIYHWCSH